MSEIQKLEQEIYDKYTQLLKLRRDSKPEPVKNYSFQTLWGETSLLDMFGGKDHLFVIHNMGQGCSYCTLWADGFSAFLPHIEEKVAVVLVSKDDPETQRRFANDRGWRFQMASHGGGDYIKEQSVAPGDSPESMNYPGMVAYERNGDQIFKKNSAVFGPGDEFCSVWNMLSLAGIGEDSWQPQYHYWKK